MPVRSLTSSVHSWPSAEKVRSALAEWAAALMEANGRVRRVGLFGSYARGDWGVGSDLDIVVLVTDTERSFVERPSSFDPYSLPVPVDLVVYTLDEWARMIEEQRGPAADPVRWIRSRSSGGGDRGEFPIPARE